MSQIELILLSLLYDKDCYGYEIESVIESRNMREWTEIGFSSIYNSLNNLEKKGLISSRFEKEPGSPKRKVYSVKEESKALITAELSKSLRSPRRVFSGFDIGMAFSYLLPREDVAESLNMYRESLQKRKQNILQRYSEDKAAQEPAHVKALFTRPLAMIDAEIEWIDRFLRE